MARTAKFTDDLLLDAVVQYSEVFHTKIKATELAAWARKNIVGLEEVKDYNFTRPYKNPTTGKSEKRLCTQRIEEINASRNISKRENINPLLSSINIDRFFDLDERSQRKAISEVKDIVAEYKRDNVNLRRKNASLKTTNKGINEQLDSYDALIKEIRKKQKVIDNKLSYLTKNCTEEQIYEQLTKMGISDGVIDLDEYNKSLHETEAELFNIDKSIRQYQRSLQDDSSLQDDTSLSNNDSDNKEESVKASIDNILNNF